MEVTQSGSQFQLIGKLEIGLAENRPLLHDVRVVVVEHDAIWIGRDSVRVSRPREGEAQKTIGIARLVSGRKAAKVAVGIVGEWRVCPDLRAVSAEGAGKRAIGGGRVRKVLIVGDV